MHVRTNDRVEVIHGDERGQRGKVLRVDARRGRVTVEGIHMVKKHMRRSQTAPQGGVLEREAAFAASNVLPVCTKCDRGVRTRHRGVGREKVRVCVKCGEAVGATR